MANVVRHEKYVCVDSEFNQKGHNKVWMFFLYANNDVLVRWGRVGGSTQEKLHSGVGSYFVDKLIGEKLKKGYKKIDTVDSVEDDNKGVSVVSNNSGLKKLAKKQIKFTNPLVQQLIDYLVEKNAHQIATFSSGKILYNADTGLFKTPLGVVTQSTIDQARTLLTKIGDWVKDSDWDNRSFVGTLSDYMTLIPQDVGFTKFGPRTLFPNLTSVQKQNDVLDSLESSYASVIAAPKTDSKTDDTKEDEPKLFDVQLELIEDKSEVNRMFNRVKATMQSMHSCSYLKPAKLYSVTIATMVADFEKVGKPINNTQSLYHGSRVSNLIAILSKGMQIPKPSAPHVCGRQFGDGAYFANSSSKSLNYSFGYWDNRAKDNRCFMFVADVALGKYYTPSSAYERLPKPGYDSTWAKANKSGVMNDEIIVYKVAQCNLTHLIEFGG